MTAGRPTSYKPEYCDQAYKLCLLGAKDTQMADFFGVSESTLNLWKKKNPKFSESLKRGKEIADIEVVKSLYKRALGYSYDEVTYEKSKTGGLGIQLKSGEVEAIKHCDINKTKVVTKEIVPDVTAQIFWLKNRQPELWRDKQEHEHKVDVTVHDVLKAGENRIDRYINQNQS